MSIYGRGDFCLFKMGFATMNQYIDLPGGGHENERRVALVNEVFVALTRIQPRLCYVERFKLVST